MKEKTNILGIMVDKYTIEEASDKIMKIISSDTNAPFCVYTPNSEMIMSAYRDKNLSEILNSADILTADGIGVVYASKIVKNPINQRCAGYDIACSLLSKMSKSHKSVYLFGAAPKIAQTAKEKIEKEYPGINVCGTADGYFDSKKEKQIIDDINSKKPDVLFVCLGAPKQEKWIHQNKDKLSAKVCIGLGGSLDVFAGNVNRAPDIFIKLGIEWLYRLINQPSRIGRMMQLPKFAVTVVLNGRKYPQK